MIPDPLNQMMSLQQGGNAGANTSSQGAGTTASISSLAATGNPAAISAASGMASPTAGSLPSTATAAPVNLLTLVAGIQAENAAGGSLEQGAAAGRQPPPAQAILR